MSEKIHCDCAGCDRVIEGDEPRLEITPCVVRTAMGGCDIGRTRHLCQECLRDPAMAFRAMLIRVLDCVVSLPPAIGENRDAD